MKILNQNLQNPIRVNHRGFLSQSNKRFILTENLTDSLIFSIILVDNVEEITVFTGEMKTFKENGDTLYEGDFSVVSKSGDYYIDAGGYRSRQFVIYDGAYDIALRTMLQYFTYQRCGHALGWAGECHLDDGVIFETGEKVDLSGGYHQSCDLRKSPGGISIGIVGLINFALKDNSSWGKILTKDEVKWACDYYVKVIQENGAMYNTLNEPFGWEGRVFYKSPAPSSAQWNTTTALALGSIYFKDIDSEISKKYLETSLRSYNYMQGERDYRQYKHPSTYPLGMDPDSFYETCRRNSSSDLAYQISAAAILYKATRDNKFVDEIKAILPKFLKFIDGFVIKRDDNTEKTVCASCSYSWLYSGILSLLDAYELIGDIYNLKDIIEASLDSLCNYIDKSVWKNAQMLYSNEDLNIVDGHENKSRKDALMPLIDYNGYFYSGRHSFEPAHSCYFGLFLARGSKLLRNPKYMKYAQYVVDYLLGANELDSSRVYAVGYNQCPQKSYGQFFPSTPFIPGAVGVGYSSIDVTKDITSEYDMPCVGLAMHLLSEVSSK